MKNESVLVLLYPGCISFEVALAAELLAKHFRILNATPDGHDLPEDSGLPLRAQLSYAQVDLENCRAVLVPGGNPDSLIGNSEVNRILQAAQARGLLMAAICAGPSVLAMAGVLKGRRIAHGYHAEQLELLKDLFHEVVLTDEPFMADANILTAKPDAHIEFAIEVSARLGAVDAKRAGRLKDYYRGTLGRKIRPLALAVIKNEKGQLLLHKAYDSIKHEHFYRPLGGGIEFHESGQDAVMREIEEELGQKVRVLRQAGTSESLFVYEGQRGHEIILLFEIEFEDRRNERVESFDIMESGTVIGQAVWRTVDEIQAEGAKLYPQGVV